MSDRPTHREGLRRKRTPYDPVLYIRSTRVPHAITHIVSAYQPSRRGVMVICGMSLASRRPSGKAPMASLQPNPRFRLCPVCEMLAKGFPDDLP